ncbi:thymidylate synthase [Roseobacter phage CRP-212]|nr:thymidylate synthase [Roseobacter phage CRP-212]
MIDVTYINHMGSDLSVVNAARVSFGKQSSWLPRVHAGEEKQLPMKDLKLIKYLAKHKHISPFGHCFASFHVKAPVFVARQLVKHKFLRWNEISRRYVDEEPEFYMPDVWRGRSADKKQGSEGTWQPNYHQLNGVMGQLKDLYDQMIYDGCAPEQARMVLPQSMMTEWYWSGSLDAFADMCALRCKPDTQEETRTVADLIDDQMMSLFPVSWEALRMYEDG